MVLVWENMDESCSMNIVATSMKELRSAKQIGVKTFRVRTNRAQQN